MNQTVYVVNVLRTPVGKAPHGVFAHHRPDDLLAHVIKSLLDRYPNLPPLAIDDVIIGCAMPEGEQGMNVARMALLLAGLPNSVPGMTINRFCSSGLQSIALGALQIAQGTAEVVLAGGTESMSMVPMGGCRMVANPNYFSDPERISMAYSMGITAEILASRYGISRLHQEEFALESHYRAVKAQAKNAFQNEIVPTVSQHFNPDLSNHTIRVGTAMITSDEGPRHDTSLEKMARLPPVFAKEGTVTAGTSSQMSDGAACALLVSAAALKQYQLTPMARWLGYSVAGVPPEIMGIGPVHAVPKVLKQTGLRLQDISWIELNEAFAAQTLAVMKDLELDPAIVNPQGGAIALGHPLGATGAIRTATLLHGLKNTRQRYGMVTMCIGTGMGAAGIFESL